MKTLETQAEYQDAKKKNDAYQLAADQWRKDNKTNGIPSEVCATFFGINGVNYAGTFYKSSGDYARVKALKSNPDKKSIDYA